MKSLNYWIKAIEKFLILKNFKIEPLPKVVLDDSPNEPDNILIRTGYYDHTQQLIKLFINNRHPKDVLRSFVHELVHHHQYLTHKELFIQNNTGKISENKQLRRLEGEAYLLGNLYFRDFTEVFSMS